MKQIYELADTWPVWTRKVFLPLLVGFFLTVIHLILWMTYAQNGYRYLFDFWHVMATTLIFVIPGMISMGIGVYRSGAAVVNISFLLIVAYYVGLDLYAIKIQGSIDYTPQAILSAIVLLGLCLLELIVLIKILANFESRYLASSEPNVYGHTRNP